MSSKKIILNCFNKKIFNNSDNKDNKDNSKEKKQYNLTENDTEILKEYFKDNYNVIKKLDFFHIIINSFLSKIKNIINFKKNINYVSKFKYTYIKLMEPFITDDIFKYEPEEIKKRYENFFSLQTLLTSKKIFSLINYQYIFSKYYNKYIYILVSVHTHFIHSEIHDFNHVYKEDENIKKFCNEYFKDFEIKKLTSSKENKKTILNSKEEKILNILGNISQNIIKKTIKLSNDDDFKKDEKNLIIYGSYTSHLINNNVSYNDIDLYHVNSLNFLIIKMMIFYFILDIDTDIFKIPYVLGHLSLRYKNHHFVDCIYLDKYTLNNIPSIQIKKINIIDPIVQMFNNFRMMSEIFRLNNIREKQEESIIKYSAFLNKSNEKFKIDYNNLYDIKNPLNFELIDNSFILINLTAGFYNFEEYKNIKNVKKFDYLIISFTQPKILFKMIEDRNDLRISKQYFALFNEICIEFENKNKNKIFKNKNKNLMKREVEIQETDIEILSKKISCKIPDELIEIIDNNNVILMSNISTNLYLKNYITKEKYCEKTILSNISKETILSSFILYNFLKKNDENLNKFYVKYFLSFLKINKKFEEFKLFENKSDYEKIIKYSKIKICGKHEMFSLKNLFFKNIFFFNLQDKDYYSYDDFIVLTNYNENLKIN